MYQLAQVPALTEARSTAAPTRPHRVDLLTRAAIVVHSDHAQADTRNPQPLTLAYLRIRTLRLPAQHRCQRRHPAHTWATLARHTVHQTVVPAQVDHAAQAAFEGEPVAHADTSADHHRCLALPQMNPKRAIA